MDIDSGKTKIRPKLKKITLLERVFELADQRKSLWWTRRERKWPAGFFQNWNARQLNNWIKNGWLMEVEENESKTMEG